MTDKGEFISRTTVQHIPQHEFIKPEKQEEAKSNHVLLDQFLGQDHYVYKQEDNELIRDDVEAQVGTSFTNEELGMLMITMDIDDYVKAGDAESEADIEMSWMML